MYNKTNFGGEHMKKSLCILTILLATFFVGLFVSCSAVEELKNFYLDKWYQYNPEKVGNLQIPIGADDDSEGSATTENISIAELYARYDSTEGLTIILAQDPESSGDYKPIYGKKTYTKEQFNTVAWATVVELGDFNAIEGEPAIAIKPALYRDLSEIVEGEGIQWKKILVNILMDWAE